MKTEKFLSNKERKWPEVEDRRQTVEDREFRRVRFLGPRQIESKAQKDVHLFPYWKKQRMAQIYLYVCHAY